MMAARYRYAGELAPCVTLNDPAVTAKDAQRIVSTGRSERIRTSGPCVPNTVLYQAELHSGRGARIALAAPAGKRRYGETGPPGVHLGRGALPGRAGSATSPPPAAPVAQLDRAPDYES